MNAPDAAGTPGGRALFGALAALLAAALVLDQVWWGGFEVVSRHGLVVLAAFVVLARPTSVARFALLAALEVVSVAADMPMVGSHRMLDLVGWGTVLAALGVMTLRARRWPRPAALRAAIAPFLRASLVVVYAAAALAKLNPVFLDPATSCATPEARPLLGALGAGPALFAAVPWATLAAEAGLAVLLALRPTRLVGVVVGMGFHGVLALAGNVPFSAAVLPFYVACLPADTPARLRAVLGRRAGDPGDPGDPGEEPGDPGEHGAETSSSDAREATFARALGEVALVAVLVGGWLAGAALGPSDGAPGLTAPPSGLVDPAVGAGATAVCLVLAAALGLVAAATILAPLVAPVPPRARGRGAALRADGLARAVLALGAVVLVVNAACPYLGLKTDTSFEMFSGLRTEPGAWNDLVVPEAVRVLGAQDAPVTVVAATDPALVARTTGGTRIVPLELDRALRARPGAVATYVADGDPVPHTLGPLPSGPTPAQRLATFRDVPPPGVPRC